MSQPSLNEPREILDFLRGQSDGFEKSDLRMINRAVTEHIAHYSLQERAELNGFFSQYRTQFPCEQPIKPSDDPFRNPPQPLEVESEEDIRSPKEEAEADATFLYNRLLTELEKQNIQEKFHKHPSLKPACESVFHRDTPDWENALNDVVRAISAGELRKRVGWTLSWLLAEGRILPKSKVIEIFGAYYRGKPYKE